MDKNRTLEFYVGIFVFLGFAAMLFMALQAANLGSFTGSGKTISVTAAFDNIGGLKARAAVKSAGACSPSFSIPSPSRRRSRWISTPPIPSRPTPRPRS